MAICNGSMQNPPLTFNWLGLLQLFALWVLVVFVALRVLDLEAVRELAAWAGAHDVVRGGEAGRDGVR